MRTKFQEINCMKGQFHEIAIIRISHSLTFFEIQYYVIRKMIKKRFANFLLKLKFGSFKEQYTQIASLSSTDDINGYITHFKKLLLHAY